MFDELVSFIEGLTSSLWKALGLVVVAFLLFLIVNYMWTRRLGAKVDRIEQATNLEVKA